MGGGECGGDDGDDGVGDEGGDGGGDEGGDGSGDEGGGGGDDESDEGGGDEGDGGKGMTLVLASSELVPCESRRDPHHRYLHVGRQGEVPGGGLLERESPLVTSRSHACVLPRPRSTDEDRCQTFILATSSNTHFKGWLTSALMVTESRREWRDAPFAMDAQMLYSLRWTSSIGGAHRDV